MSPTLERNESVSVFLLEFSRSCTCFIKFFVIPSSTFSKVVKLFNRVKDFVAKQMFPKCKKSSYISKSYNCPEVFSLLCKVSRFYRKVLF